MQGNQNTVHGQDNKAIQGNSNIVSQGNSNIQNIHITNYYYRENIRLTAEQSADDSSVNKELPCPYRGLFHFGPDDAEYFFGREVLIEELFKATQTRNFIPVLGASGSGKSSVVFAGLIPKLQKEGYWLFTHFRPGSDPFHALAEALVPLYALNLDATDKICQARKLAKFLSDGEVSLDDVISQIQCNYPQHRILLIADQLEELYAFCHDEKVRHNFIDKLLISLQSFTSKSLCPIVLVTTLRIDFLGHILSYPALADMFQNTDVKVRSMKREELLQSIEKPAQKLGVTFENGLVVRILNAFKNSPESLPLLEFALTLLWERRTNQQLTHAGYQAIGEVQGALAGRAEEVFNTFNVTEKQEIRLIFLQLVNVGEDNQYTRRIAEKVDLGEEKWPLLQKLVNARLLITNRNEVGEETVEIVHETLTLYWQRLYNWIDENRHKLKQKQEIEYAAKLWLRKNMPTQSAYLLEGSELTEAKKFLQTHAKNLPLSDLATKFVQQSILQDRKKRHLSLIVASSLVLLAGIGSGIEPFFQFLENQTRSIFLQLRGAVVPPKDIVILAIDEPSTLTASQYYQSNPQKYAYLEPVKSWPFKRAAYAQVIEKLMQAGAQSVAVNLLFSTSSSYGANDDRQLQTVLQKYGNKITLAAFYNQYDVARGSIISLELPQKLFRQTNVSIGSGNFLLGRDGKIHKLGEAFFRSLPTEFNSMHKMPSFGRAVLKASGVNYSSPKGEYIYFYGGNGTFKRISFIDVLDPENWNNYLQKGKDFQNKIVLIGPTAKSLGNYYSVPLDNWFQPETMAGVEIHANAIATLMEGKTIAQPIKSRPLRVLFTLVLVGTAAIIVTRNQQKFMSSIVLASIWVGIAYVSLIYGQIILPTTIPAIAIVLIPIFSFRKS